MIFTTIPPYALSRLKISVLLYLASSLYLAQIFHSTSIQDSETTLRHHHLTQPNLSRIIYRREMKYYICYIYYYTVELYSSKPSTIGAYVGTTDKWFHH